MVSNTIKLSLGSLLFFLIIACTSNSKDTANVNVKKKIIDTCIYYYRYDANRIISNLGCRNCHLRMLSEEKDDRGWATFRGLATMDSLKLVNYAFTNKHKGWYSKKGTFKTARMDTLSQCEIKSVIRYIKDFGRDIPMSNQ